MGKNTKSLNDRFVDFYTYVLAFLSFLAIAASLSFAFRNVRGTFQNFMLDHSNAPLFFAGALLICCSLFSAIIYLIGPIGHSAGEIFWRFPGRGHLPKNPWKAMSIWGALVLWSLCTVLLATIFAPLSTLWLAGTATGAILYGIVLIFGALGAQVLNKTKLFHLWSTVSCLAGTFIIFFATTSVHADATNSNNIVLLLSSIALALLAVGAGLSGVLALISTRKPLNLPATMQADGRRSELLAALANIGSPQGFTYPGSSHRFFRRRFTHASPIWISLASAFDSWQVFLAVFTFSLPFAIFLGIALGKTGAVIVLMIACWIIATLLRWLCREWTAQRSLRSWMGGSYLVQLLGFAVGPSIACALCAGVGALIFGLPMYIVLIAFIMGFTVSLGDESPPQQIHYDLVITTHEGVAIPIELFAVALTFFLMVGLHLLAVLAGPLVGISMSLLLLAVTLFQHYRAR